MDSVFAHSDPSAAGVLAALHEAGLWVPQDVAVVGFDDLEMASYASLVVRGSTSHTGSN